MAPRNLPEGRSGLRPLVLEGLLEVVRMVVPPAEEERCEKTPPHAKIEGEVRENRRGGKTACFQRVLLPPMEHSCWVRQSPRVHLPPRGANSPALLQRVQLPPMEYSSPEGSLRLRRDRAVVQRVLLPPMEHSSPKGSLRLRWGRAVDGSCFQRVQLPPMEHFLPKGSSVRPEGSICHRRGTRGIL